MRGIDWDKVRRNRKVWKRDYSDMFSKDRRPAHFHFSSSPGSINQKGSSVSEVRRHFFSKGSKPASEVRQRLSSLGLKGKKLKNTVNEILVGKKVLANVEGELWVESLFTNGFEFDSFEEGEKTAVMRFVKRHKTGAIEEEASITLTRP